MMRRRRRRFLAVVGTIAFLAGSGASPMVAGDCPRHAAGAASADHPASPHVDHDVHRDGGEHAGSPEAPSDEHGHDCRCLGECCPGVSPARDAVAGPAPPDAGRATVDASVAERDRPVPPGPRLLPFANGPPLPA